ncbi:LysE family translocator [Mesorhizobium amorphae]|uniref:Amino acid transporter LysE n=1 Tax=Mesorhizobium amorphae CCNWGS0123 TaxID=1082933 RepID=G6YAZ3_9HYPH|nr:LysE family translocator [Mesorhizobium amorphae]EHH11077.1 amino acid transporter LysE [Mesorhizobium amorphae CCNWGS0123]GLR43252.1 hypothetical protein GCM10007880_37690 [Mesorhizobium amorphae]
MFPIDIWLAYTIASVLIVLAPGPDIVLSIARGLSQGRLAATVSGMGAGTGILIHSLAATFGLALLIQTSAAAFLALKLAGAAYLVWLGAKALFSRNLVSFAPTARRPLHAIYLAGLMSNVLNPKIGLFVLAFIPQFVSADRGLACHHRRHRPFAHRRLCFGFEPMAAQPSARGCRDQYRRRHHIRHDRPVRRRDETQLKPAAAWRKASASWPTVLSSLKSFLETGSGIDLFAKPKSP